MKTWEELTNQEKNHLRKWDYSTYAKLLEDFKTKKYIEEVEQDLENIEIKSVKMGGSFTASGVTWSCIINKGLENEYSIKEIYSRTNESKELQAKLRALVVSEFTPEEIIDIAKKMKPRGW